MNPSHEKSRAMVAGDDCNKDNRGYSGDNGENNEVGGGGGGGSDSGGYYVIIIIIIINRLPNTICKLDIFQIIISTLTDKEIGFEVLTAVTAKSSIFWM
jgi:hypothetical protein